MTAATLEKCNDCAVWSMNDFRPARHAIRPIHWLGVERPVVDFGLGEKEVAVNGSSRREDPAGVHGDYIFSYVTCQNLER